MKHSEDSHRRVEKVCISSKVEETVSQCCNNCKRSVTQTKVYCNILVQGFVKMSNSHKMVFLLNVNHAHFSHVVRLYSKDTIILYYLFLYCIVLEECNPLCISFRPQY